ncbi:hypothetical protein PoB_005625000 [Plakobranchus ocellatus]|uniref:Uncharacterized protein n=1 Tax=Plakobranchus ocellatus TaxID=259542 RepID=A0AAV4CE75_9GAST|nr:hypothetical protein PoB_005625000 [Plakobranchus ocellatus]
MVLVSLCSASVAIKPGFRVSPLSRQDELSGFIGENRLAVFVKPTCWGKYRNCDTLAPYASCLSQRYLQYTFGLSIQRAFFTPHVTWRLPPVFGPIRAHITELLCTILNRAANEILSKIKERKLAFPLARTDGTPVFFLHTKGGSYLLRLKSVGGTVDSESVLRSTGFLLLGFRAPSPAPRPDGEPGYIQKPKTIFALSYTHVFFSASIGALMAQWAENLPPDLQGPFCRGL